MIFHDAAAGGMLEALDYLSAQFDEIAVPDHGRYVRQPALTDERGAISIPPSAGDPVKAALAGAVLAGAVLFAVFRRRSA